MGVAVGAGGREGIEAGMGAGGAAAGRQANRSDRLAIRTNSEARFTAIPPRLY
jgi:hypothetical protein